jgi:hypothetical protein
MTPELIAHSRTESMSDRDGADFMTAYYAALSAHRCGRDLDDVRQAARLNPDTSDATLAGLVEGMAAARGGES